MKSVAIGIALAVLGCGPSDNRGTDAAGGSGSNNGSNNGSGNQDACSDSAKLVYVVDESNTFSKFDPSTKTFTDLGNLSCPTAGGIFGGATPFSMGVDRNTVAWVLYNDGELFRVDILNSLACTKTNWASADGLMQFGMGFSTDTAGGTTDTLFVAGGQLPAGSTPTSSTLAKLDTGSMSANTVGTVQGWPELTGTGSAELWGWFPDPNSPRVEQIDKTSGLATKTYPLASLAGNPMAWAFAFWGGDFWVFLQRDTDAATSVYQIDGMTGSIKSTTPTNTRVIVGAGVSTCAPVVIARQQ
jgi:hypothetical protein